MEYTKELLKCVQNKETEILLVFDRICKANNISYSLFGGTLLGAVRHKGFIPWDDDIDVCMLRSDYERFIEVCMPDVLGEKYFLQTNETDPTSVIQFAKIRCNGTVFEPENEINSESHKGIYIDIFPLDNVMPNTPKGQKQYRDFEKWYAVVTSTVKSRVNVCKTPWKKVLRICFYLLSRVVPKQVFDKKLKKILTQYNSRETRYVNHMTNGTGGNRMERFLAERKAYLDLIELEFEGHNFPAPRDYNGILTRCYGDYMKLPPVEEQKPHHGIVRLEL